MQARPTLICSWKRAALALVFALATGPISTARAEIAFEETTGDLGISNLGQSWGLAWGDFDGDGDPDLWTGNHGRTPHLYRNDNGLSFRNIASSVIPPVFPRPPEDSHGAAWGDFDNDGDQDLIELDDNGRSNTAPNQLFENLDGASLRDRSATWGVAYRSMRGRTPLWLDFDRDGRLDLLLSSQFRAGDEGDFLSPTLLRQGSGTFELVQGWADVLDETIPTYFSSLSDLTGDGIPDVLLRGAQPADISLFDTSAQPFRKLDTIVRGTDVAIGDFNGDLRPDLFLVKSGVESILVRVSDVEVRAQIRPSIGEELGVDLENTGDLTVYFSRGWAIATEGVPVLVGANAVAVNPSQPFLLEAANPDTAGIAAHTPGSETGIYIGREPGTSTWRVRTSNVPLRIAFALTSSSALLEAEAVGFNSSASPANDQVMINSGDGFTDVSSSSGLDTPSWGTSVATADFDNDMDADVYVVGTSGVANRPNTLWENLGTGIFARVSDAGGALGSDLGKGDAVALADYDLDGFIDLALTNGQAAAPFDIGPVQVYRNVGNSNHWLEIDLEGVVSNRDGVGAKVLASTQGVTQLREQNSGMHLRAQNHARLHFGLAQNHTVDQLLVEWPSGTVQAVHDIEADQIIRILEASYPSALGQPAFTPAEDVGVYLWQDTCNGPYTLQVSAAAVAQPYLIQILAEAPFSDVSPLQLETQDSLQWEANAISISGYALADVDGIVFSPPQGRAFIAVELFGAPNPRQLHVGATGGPVTPAGWILDLDELPPLPSFDIGADLGLFLGKTSTPDQLAVRWSGDGPSDPGHRFGLEMLASRPFAGVESVDFEPCCDSLTAEARWLEALATASNGQDGLDVLLEPGTRVGIFPRQDGLFQSQRANGMTRDLGAPNAYRLPSSRGSLPDDLDIDCVVDPQDNCPHWSNPDQIDSDGNGIGDPCECGDQTEDGVVDVADLLAINAALFDPTRISPLCDTNEDGLCDVRDILGVNAKIFGAAAYCSRYPSNE
jgi:hypothetical protein